MLSLQNAAAGLSVVNVDLQRGEGGEDLPQYYPKLQDASRVQEDHQLLMAAMATLSEKALGL